MNHLVVSQNSNIEVLGTSSDTIGVRIIEKLYELAHAGLDSSSSLSGNLQVSKAYRDSVEWLLLNTGLNITVTGSYYIRFADSEVARICNANWGDGIGVSETLAQVPTTLNYIFKNNSSIEHFDELKYFTNIKTIEHNSNPRMGNDGDFYNCSNLKTLDATNIEYIYGSFLLCYELVEIKNFQGYGIARYQMYSGIFSECSKLTTINLSNCEYIGLDTFVKCTSLRNIGDLKKIKRISGWAFLECSSLEIDVNMPDFGNVYPGDPHDHFTRSSDHEDARTWFYLGTFFKSGIRSISNLGTICSKILDAAWGANRYGFAADCPNLRFVILPSLLVEIGTCAFRNNPALEYVKCLATTPPTLNLTDITNSEFPFYNTTCKFYVPDASLSAYQTTSGWDALYNANRLFPLSLFSTDFPND